MTHAAAPIEAPSPFVSDAEHPDQADYIATNLLDALEQVPNTGDWWQEVKSWCERVKTGKMSPLRLFVPVREKAGLTLDQFETALLDLEEPLTAALDVLHDGDWTEHDADLVSTAFMAAVEAAREKLLGEADGHA